LPRSGKSYRAVWYIFSNFLNPKSKDFNKHHYLYTNIGGFKHDHVNEILNDDNYSISVEGDEDDLGRQESSNIIKKSIYLDWDVFYKHLSKLHEMAKADKSDEELLKYARYHKLTPALFVIDEAYRFYKKSSDPVLVWWHGYHGHLGHDILIIIHRPSLMHSDYKAHTEEFIDAQPKSKSLTNNRFRYFFYSDDFYSKKNNYSSDSLTAKSEIFDLYKSGDLHKPKKIVHKFIGYIILALLFIFFIGKSFYDRTSEKLSTDQTDESEPVSNASPSTTVSAPSAVSTFDSNSIFIRVRCDQTSCARIDPAVQLHYIPKLYFEDSLKYFSNKLITSSTVVIFDTVYNDRLYSVSKDYLTALGVWSIPSFASNQVSSPPVNSVVGGAQ
jgi:hypothetical protein